MRVVIVGASVDRAKYGNRAVRAYVRAGHEVFPVNPNHPEIEGLRSWASILDVPGPIDRIAMYVPPETGEDVVDQLALRTDIGEIWFNPGSGTPELMAAARRFGLTAVRGCAILDIGEVP